jgi:hypothetical protein
MVWTGHALAAALIAAAAALPAAAAAPRTDTTKTTEARQLPAQAARLHDWILEQGDNGARPFAIVDKKGARLFVFDGTGRLRGATSALLGQAVGDESAPDVGEHTQQGFVPVQERTTPAGRFVAKPGINVSGEKVIWVDYEAAFAIHRLRPGRSMRAREQRLASPRAEDHRVSYGCVVVPVRFYTHVVQRWLGKGPSVVYVLPESGDAAELLGGA